MDDANTTVGRLDLSSVVEEGLAKEGLTVEQIKQAIDDPGRVAAYDAITDSTILMGRTTGGSGPVVVAVLGGEDTDPEDHAELHLLSARHAAEPEIRLYEKGASTNE